MNKICDYNEISPLILKYFKKGVMTNNFLTPDDYKAEINEGRLFFESSDDFLNLYVKREGFYIMYFYTFKKDFIFPEINETIIADVPEEYSEFLENNGYKKILTRIGLDKPKSDGETQFRDSAKEEDAEEIFSLIKNTFDKFTGFSPNLSGIRRECQSGLLKIERTEGEISGILRIGKKGNILVIKHLLTNEKYRGKGISKSLLSGIKDKATVWTGSENIPAINLYKSMGFEENGKKSLVYKKGNDKNDN